MMATDPFSLGHAGSFGHLFWESDCAKWLEGACYFLKARRDPALQAQVDELIAAMLSAQQKDGYLNINFIVTEPQKRWTNVRDLHEMYNAGHCFEAAVAHFHATQDDTFLKAMVQFAHHIGSLFGPEKDKKHGYPGHPEIELALTKMYNATQDAACLDLAAYFLSERGRDNGRFYKEEQAARGDDPRIHPGSWPTANCEWYQQAHDLIVNQETVEGHAVRVGYLLTGLADLLVLERGGKDQRNALERLWINLVSKRSSVTGGIGAAEQWEGFARNDYQLPNGLDEGGCYNETCAGISLLMLADRMQRLGLNGPGVTDIAERVLYNSSAIAGVSLDGKLFTYENRLASSPNDPCKRYPYFDCSCCPPNVLRTLAIIGGYFWSPVRDGTIAIHHYCSGRIDAKDVCAEMKTDFPLTGKISLSVKKGTTLLRIPSWSLAQVATMDALTRYATYPVGEWELDLEVQPRLIYSHPYTGKNELAIAYGPLIYCLEDVDNPAETAHAKLGNSGHFKDMTIHPMIIESFIQVPFADSQGHKIIKLFAPAAGRRLLLPAQPAHLADQAVPLALPELHEPPTVARETYDLTFVPYYYRANRGGEDMMRVWLKNRSSFSVAKGTPQSATGEAWQWI